ncbi:MAG TPA: hypothetical protein VLS45_05905, partial [Methylomicrobium sp.]|nr:hypothetical protein [Methylomicrobium sp.]
NSAAARRIAVIRNIKHRRSAHQTARRIPDSDGSSVVDAVRRVDPMHVRGVQYLIRCSSSNTAQQRSTSGAAPVFNSMQHCGASRRRPSSSSSALSVDISTTR